jgi:N-acyl homoserine lactone hydrolase
MAARELYLLDSGYSIGDRSALVAGTPPGQTFHSPITACLIKTDEGPVLVDAGAHPEGRVHPEVAMGERAPFNKLVLTEEDDLRSRLREVGVKPEEVRYVILSHLHWDHVGCCGFFPQATFVIQKAEWRFGLYPDKFLGAVYVRPLFEGIQKLDLREGDGEVVPGVSVISTPGHSPGHQAVVVSLPETGTVILARDAVMCRDNIERRLPGGLTTNPQAAMESVHRIAHLSRQMGALIVTGHEPDCWSVYRRSPEGYR